MMASDKGNNITKFFLLMMIVDRWNSISQFLMLMIMMMDRWNNMTQFLLPMMIVLPLTRMIPICQLMSANLQMVSLVMILLWRCIITDHLNIYSNLLTAIWLVYRGVISLVCLIGYLLNTPDPKAE